MKQLHHISILYKIFTCLVIGTLLSANLFSQVYTPYEEYLQEEVKQKDFDRNTWQKATEDIDYSAEEKDKDKDKADTPDQGGRNYPGNSPQSWGQPSRVVTFLMKGLIILVIAAIVAVLLYNILGFNFQARKKTTKSGATGEKINIEKLEENLHESDLDRYLRQALEQKNYALAIRIYYLAVLKELSLRQLIRWKKDKTNRDYLLEMGGRSMFSSFREITAIFERIWYGQNELSEKSYRKISPLFKDFIDQLNTK